MAIHPKDHAAEKEQKASYELYKKTGMLDAFRAAGSSHSTRATPSFGNRNLICRKCGHRFKRRTAVRWLTTANKFNEELARREYKKLIEEVANNRGAEQLAGEAISTQQPLEECYLVAEVAQREISAGLGKALGFFSNGYRGAAREALLDLAAVVRSRDDVGPEAKDILGDFLYDAAAQKSESMIRELLAVLAKREMTSWLKSNKQDQSEN
jgi:hypothetical protein